MEEYPACRGILGRLRTIVFGAVVVKAVLICGLLPYFQVPFSRDYNSERFPDGYDRIAWNLVQGNGYRVFPDTSPTMLRTPAFVLVLAVLFAVFGQSLLAVQIMNLVFSSVTAISILVLARKVGLSRTATAIAALIFLFHPGVLVAESRGGPESMLTLCLVASVVLAVIAMEKRDWPSYAIAGGVNGLALLVKSSVAPVLPALVLYRLWKTNDGLVRKKLLVGAAICGLATALVMTPWVVRNYRLSGEFIPTMTVSGLAAFQGEYIVKHLDSNHENFEVMEQAVNEQVAIANAMGLKEKGRFFPQFSRVEDEVSFYRELGRRVLDDYRQQPELILRSIVHDSWAFWVGGKTHKASIFNAILAVPLLALAGIGLRIGTKQGLRVFPLFLVIVAFMIPHLFILAMARYYIPVVPFLAVLSAIPLAQWLDGFAFRGRPSRQLGNENKAAVSW